MAAPSTTRKPRARTSSPAGVSSESEGPSLAVFRLQSHLTLAHAPQLLDDLKKAIAAPGNLQVQADAVERIDGTCLQVLLSAELTLRNSGRSLEIVQASEFFRHAVALLGLGEWLGGTQGEGGAKS